jgi:hypothetical protein
MRRDDERKSAGMLDENEIFANPSGGVQIMKPGKSNFAQRSRSKFIQVISGR